VRTNFCGNKGFENFAGQFLQDVNLKRKKHFLIINKSLLDPSNHAGYLATKLPSQEERLQTFLISYFSLYYNLLV